jgi:hypothetical protein
MVFSILCGKYLQVISQFLTVKNNRKKRLTFSVKYAILYILIALQR